MGIIRRLQHILQVCCLLILIAPPLQADEPRPVIGVSGSSESSASVQFLLAQLYHHGAYPVLLDPKRIDSIEADMAKLDGVIIGGNSWDINNADYGEKANPKTNNEDGLLGRAKGANRRADYEYALLDEVFRRGDLPFLGICSGMQRLNVHDFARDGGKLIQHVPGQLQWNPLYYNPLSAADRIRVSPKSRLQSLVDAAEQTTFGENSVHHQVVDPNYIRRGFIESARSAEFGTIEAIEPDPEGPYATLPIMAVQWHPEYGISKTSRSLFQDIVATARARMTTPASPEALDALDRLSPEMRETISRPDALEFLADKHGYAYDPAP